jgi:hypothetical protein
LVSEFLRPDQVEVGLRSADRNVYRLGPSKVITENSPRTREMCTRELVSSA